MTREELEKLRAIAEAATPGPWEESSYRVMTVGPKDLGMVAYLANNKATRTIQASKNTSFIASLNPQTALALIEMCEAAVEIIEEVFLNGRGRANLPEGLGNKADIFIKKNGLYDNKLE